VTSGAPIRLLTLNVLFRGDVRTRMRALSVLFEQSDYDIVCLQEVLWRGSLRLLRAEAPSYPHVAASGAILLSGGLAVLSRWPLRRVGFTRYAMSKPIRPELLMAKGAQAVVVRTPAGELAVVNTHLSANSDDDWSPANRFTAIARAELGQLGQVVDALDPALPVVVVGDLNVPRESAALAAFREAAGLHDVLAGDTRPTYRPTPSWATPPAFDHVLIRAGAGAQLAGQARLVLQDAVRLPDGRSMFLSDHYGIETDLRLS
jgi:endonuclease/exonuclease/phosphatase family metal-dependent hydrolase